MKFAINKKYIFLEEKMIPLDSIKTKDLTHGLRISFDFKVIDPVLAHSITRDMDLTEVLPIPKFRFSYLNFTSDTSKKSFLGGFISVLLGLYLKDKEDFINLNNNEFYFLIFKNSLNKDFGLTYKVEVSVFTRKAWIENKIRSSTMEEFAHFGSFGKPQLIFLQIQIIGEQLIFLIEPN